MNKMNLLTLSRPKTQNEDKMTTLHLVTPSSIALKFCVTTSHFKLPVEFCIFSFVNIFRFLLRFMISLRSERVKNPN